MKKFLLFASYILVAALASVLTLAISFFLDEDSKLTQLSALIESRYIEETDKTALEDAAAKAMVKAAGDRWSYYISAADYAAYREDTKNAYVGIGITIIAQENGEGLEILQVAQNGPAAEAGLQVGDVIIAIEGQPMTGMTTSEARDLVRGEENTPVEITVLRGREELVFSVLRREVQEIVASGQMLTDRVGMVTIRDFETRCAEETIGAIENLLDQGARMLVFDVRNNPGGYAHEMVEILDYLLPEGALFRTVDYRGREAVETSDAGHLDVPMVVLVNGETYSAAEFFAVALQEYGAAVVVGEKTTGKGYFQQTFPLNDGSAVALSTGKYFTPKGVSLEGVGITPDVEVPLDEQAAQAFYYGQLDPEEDAQIQAALELLK